MGNFQSKTKDPVFHQAAEDDRSAESYQLTWPGKRHACKAATIPVQAKLIAYPADAHNNKAAPNRFIEGDNLDALKLLAADYTARIKVIYIDPPYNTGKDFVYQDRWDHATWLNMIYPRLLLARPLLRDDGLIFVSIDDNEVHNLRLIMDEVFGAANFVTQFVWHSSTAGGIRAKHVNQNHEYALCYAKDSSALPKLFAPLSPEAIKQYNREDARGRYREKDFAWITTSTNERQRYLIRCPDGTFVQPRPGYLFRFVRERFDAALAEDLVVFKPTGTSPLIDEHGERAPWNIYIKKYLDNGLGAPSSLIPKSLVGISNRGTAEIKRLFGDRVFNNAKPTTYLRYLLAIGLGEERDDNAIVLDFFAGSCSTAHAVLAMNAEDGGTRRFIMVQSAEPTPSTSVARQMGFATIAAVGRERIQRVIAELTQEGHTINRVAQRKINNYSKSRVQKTIAVKMNSG